MIGKYSIILENKTRVFLQTLVFPANPNNWGISYNPTLLWRVRSGGRARVQHQQDAQRNCEQKDMLASPPSFFFDPFVENRCFSKLLVRDTQL